MSGLVPSRTESIILSIGRRWAFLLVSVVMFNGRRPYLQIVGMTVPTSGNARMSYLCDLLSGV